jgi:multimeric flavodoxin WrbA
MKVLGLTCGRKLSNTEILVKEALMGAKDNGAEVEIVRLMDLNLKPCTGCNACVINLFEKAGSGRCVINDDLEFIDEKIMDCDAIVVGTPIYEKAPTGYLKILNDRMGPSHDLAFKMIAKKIRKEKNITTGKGPDERSFKPRIASLIGVGGSDWVELTLPMLQLFVLSMQIKVVDQNIFNWIALPGVVSLKEDMLKRAYDSGVHIAKSFENPIEEAKYIGEKGLCPVCNSNLFDFSNPKKAVCAVCGIKGTLKIENDTAYIEVSEEEKKISHVNLAGKFKHAEDLNTISLKPPKNMKDISKKLEKYKSFLDYSKP